MFSFNHGEHPYSLSVKTAKLPSKITKESMEKVLGEAVEKATIENSLKGFNKIVSESHTIIGKTIFVTVISK